LTRLWSRRFNGAVAWWRPIVAGHRSSPATEMTGCDDTPPSGALVQKVAERVLDSQARKGLQPRPASRERRRGLWSSSQERANAAARACPPNLCPARLRRVWLIAVPTTASKVLSSRPAGMTPDSLTVRTSGRCGMVAPGEMVAKETGKLTVRLADVIDEPVLEHERRWRA